MKLDLEQKLSPTKRFAVYFEYAKSNYEFINEGKKATQKAITQWYNKTFQASLSEGSLSKYLSGTNDIPIKVYMNMKELAGIEEIYTGMGASREDYEIACEIKESLSLVKEEIEYICSLKGPKSIQGASSKEIMRLLVNYCEYASKKEYENEIALLHELKETISKNETELRKAMERRTMAPSGYNDLFLQSSDFSHTLTEYVDANEMDDYEYLFDLKKRYHCLSTMIDKCIEFHNSISLNAYMDIPVMEESEILKSIRAKC